MSKENIHVTRRASGDGAVKGEGDERASSLHDTKKAVLGVGRKLAQVNESELVIHGRDNRIINKDSFGNDPNHPRDKKH